MSGKPFNRCTHTALSPKGEIYVSDGYGNARVHKYSPDGKLPDVAGASPAPIPGSSTSSTTSSPTSDGWVYVADRENHRVQVFDGNGKYETQWNNMHRPCAPIAAAAARRRTSSSASSGPACRSTASAPISARGLPIVDAKGKRIARLGGEDGPGQEPGKFLAPHGLAVDSRGDIYVGEVCYTNWKTSFPDTPQPKTIRSLQKLARVP